MIFQQESFDLICQEITKNHLEFMAVIQDIQQCSGPEIILNQLNIEGRGKLASLKNSIEKLSEFVEQEPDQRKKKYLSQELSTRKEQLSAALAAFRKANAKSSFIINNKARNELLELSKEQQETLLRRRGQKTLADMASEGLEQMQSISKQFAETVQEGALTLDNLVMQTDKTSSTQKELENQMQALVQSEKLLKKYSRREVTDKVLSVVAFICFFIVVFFIIYKRI